MKNLVITLLTLSLMVACGKKNVREWSDSEINEWFDNSKWNTELGIKPDNSIDKRSFVEQNVLNPESWEAVYNFYKEKDLNTLELGRHDLHENGTFVNIEEYNTKDSAHFEAHKRFIDIQYLSRGKEYIRVSSLDNITNQVEVYDEKRDIEFFDKDDYTAHMIDGSNFMVLFPHEAHMPCMKVDSTMHVRKVVAKIPFVE